MHLFGGKMANNFGNAWDVTPGVLGTDLAEEYEMAENIALGGAFNGDLGEGGRHIVSAQIFFLDTSDLADSAFTRRPKPRRADGGPGNTGDFSSFSVAVDGGDYPTLPGFRYHAAYVHQGNDTVAAESITYDPVHDEAIATYPGANRVLVFKGAEGALVREIDTEATAGIRLPRGICLHPYGEHYAIVGDFNDIALFRRGSHERILDRSIYTMLFGHSHITAV